MKYQVCPGEDWDNVILSGETLFRLFMTSIKRTVRNTSCLLMFPKNIGVNNKKKHVKTSMCNFVQSSKSNLEMNTGVAPDYKATAVNKGGSQLI